MTTEYVWEPLGVDELRAVLEPLGIRWWVAGGWAIDLFLGQQTRPHGDIDVAVLRSEHLQLAALQPQWELHIADAGRLTPWDGRTPLRPSEHQFWVRRANASAWSFELLFEESDGETWRFRRDPTIALPLDRFGAVTDGNVPYIRPEIALLYKARHADVERNEADFRETLPRLDKAARSWLKQTLELLTPGHSWMAQL